MNGAILLSYLAKYCIIPFKNILFENANLFDFPYWEAGYKSSIELFSTFPGGFYYDTEVLIGSKSSMDIQSYYDRATQPVDNISVNLNTTEDTTLEVKKEQLGEISMLDINPSTVLLDNGFQASLLRDLRDTKQPLHTSPNANLPFFNCLIKVVGRVRFLENKHIESSVPFCIYGQNEKYAITPIPEISSHCLFHQEIPTLDELEQKTVLNEDEKADLSGLTELVLNLNGSDI